MVCGDGGGFSWNGGVEVVAAAECVRGCRRLGRERRVRRMIEVEEVKLEGRGLGFWSRCGRRVVVSKTEVRVGH